MSRPSALRIFVKTVIARAYPRTVGHARNWSWVVIEIVLPLIGTVAMVYVYRALRAPAEYTGFVVLGGTLLAFWQNIVFDMAGNFIWERGGSNLELFTVAPTTFTAILLGMALGGIFYTAQYLDQLERHGVRVVNGTRAFLTEISKARQLALLDSLGLAFPRARVIGADDDAIDALVEPALDRRHVADAAAELHAQADRVENAIDRGGIYRLARKGAVEIDDVEMPETRRLEALRESAGPAKQIQDDRTSNHVSPSR